MDNDAVNVAMQLELEEKITARIYSAINDCVNGYPNSSPVVVEHPNTVRVNLTNLIKIVISDVINNHDFIKAVDTRLADRHKQLSTYNTY